jgi:para-nitrobenzyl esterase
MGNLSTNKVYAWTPEDYAVSKTMEEYFANFIKTGNPNGAGLLEWPAYKAGNNFQRMRLDVNPRVEAEPHRDRFLALDALPVNP